MDSPDRRAMDLGTMVRKPFVVVDLSRMDPDTLTFRARKSTISKIPFLEVQDGNMAF